MSPVSFGFCLLPTSASSISRQQLPNVPPQCQQLPAGRGMCTHTVCNSYCVSLQSETHTHTHTLPQCVMLWFFLQSEGPRKVTEAKPFNFRLDSRFPSKHPATEGGEKKNLVPTAEFVFKFQAKTPERFRGLTRKNLHSASACVEEASHTTASSSNSSRAGLTIPCTPKLLTKCRTRPVLAKSSEELEEEQLAHIKQSVHTL